MPSPRRKVTKKQSAGLYRTPAWATRALFEGERFTGTILEPCAGGGDMVDVLREHGLPVEAGDIAPRREDIPARDFRDWTEAENVITNPPFPLADEILEHFLPITRRKIALLLPLRYLEGARRFWRIYGRQDRAPKRVHVFTERVTMWAEEAERTGNGSTMAVAWFVWDLRLPDDDPRIQWVVPGSRPR